MIGARDNRRIMFQQTVSITATFKTAIPTLCKLAFCTDKNILWYGEFKMKHY